MKKQDMQGVRTAAQLEQKYNFPKNLAEVMGVARNAQTSAQRAESTAEEALKVANSVNKDEIVRAVLAALPIYNGEVETI